MLTLEQAKEMFKQLIISANEKYTIEKVWEIQFEDPIYVMMTLDEEGNQIWPGEVFPSIRKRDGLLVYFEFPPTG